MLSATISIIGVIIAIFAHNRAVEAEKAARQAAEAAARPVEHTVEIRHVRVNRSELPPLPDFMQPRRLALPDFIQQPKGEPPHAN